MLAYTVAYGKYAFVQTATGIRAPEVLANADYQAVAVGASLGGIDALSRILSVLPAGFPVPVLVVQHLRRGKPSLLAKILAHHTGLHVWVAVDGVRPAAGSVYVAPPDRHMLLRPNGTLGLADTDPVNFCRPSADVLFRSVADVHGLRSIGVVLSGLGRDGASGLGSILRAGGAAIAQDAGAEATGMPYAAADIGQADLILPVEEIGFALRVMAGMEEEPGSPRVPPGGGGRAPMVQPEPMRLRCRAATIR